MDEGLFAKYARTITARNTTKQTIIEAILEKTGIQVEQDEIVIVKKEIILSVSSVKKMALTKKNIQEVMSSLGYALKR
jgi:hypothetical protein